MLGIGWGPDERSKKVPAIKRNKVEGYPGVYWIEGTGPKGEPIRIYYIIYRKDGRWVEEKAGSFGMTPAKANNLRVEKIKGAKPTNKERRAKKRAEKEVSDNRWTFNRLWKAYMEAKPDLKGLVTDENRYENHIKPDFGEKAPQEVIPLDVDRLRIRLLKNRKPQTVKNVLALLKRLVNFGVSRHLCEPFAFKITMPKVDNEKTEVLTPEQLKSLLKVLDSTPDIQIANMMKMALYTGMRRGELLRLHWSDVDFERGFIRIRSPKGGKSQNIPLNSKAREILRAHPRTKSKYIFPGRDGGPRRCIKRALNAIKEDAGLPDDFRPLHGLRHVYASMLASSGRVDMYTLQKLLTHKSPQMTQRYAHLRDETLRQASELMGGLVAAQTEKKKVKRRKQSS